MFIFFAITFAIIIVAHKTLIKAVDNYNYGYGSHEEWREFEKQFQYSDAVKF
jgi:hypothetical protein